MRRIVMRVAAALRRAARSLTVQVTAALILLAFLPTAVLGWLALQSIAAASRETAARAYAATADATATALSTYVDAAAHNLRVFADGVRLLPAFDASIEPTLRRFIIEHPSFRRITIVDARHRVLATSALAARPGTVTLQPSSAIDDGISLTTVTDPDALMPIAQLVTTLTRDRSATLVADVSLENLWRTVSTLKLPPEAQAMLVDAGGRVLAHSNPAHYMAVARGFDVQDHPSLRSKTSQGTTYTGADGVEWLTIAAPLSRLDWTLFIEQPTRVLDQPAIVARRQLSAVLGLTLISAALAMLFVSGTLTAPLQTLTHATRALAAGERVPTVPVPRHQELANLARAFNFLASRRETLETMVRRQERESAIAQIGAGLLHDLAHPIRNIVNNARLLQKLPAPASRDCLQLIEREYATIEELFGNLKEFSKTSPPLAQPVLPHHILRDIATRLQHDADARGVTLRTVDAVIAPILSDPGALRRVLRNLTVNAIEAAQATQGTVTLTAEEHDAHIRITVRDTGPGLSPEQLAGFFDALRSTKRKGLGLGLATAKWLTEQMGGTLTATSAVGAGTTCIVDLPRRPGQPSILPQVS